MHSHIVQDVPLGTFPPKQRGITSEMCVVSLPIFFDKNVIQGDSEKSIPNFSFAWFEQFRVLDGALHV